MGKRQTNWQIRRILIVGLLFFLTGNGQVSALVARRAPLSTPVTALTHYSTSFSCTSTPYISCSGSATKTQTDAYRMDFDITYNYNDNRTNFGSDFKTTMEFRTGVFYTEVPIWWIMYPTQNEIPPNRPINVQYTYANPDVPSMLSPTGSWTIPSIPYPYQKFWVYFIRSTSAPEVLVRTDRWHFAIATYPICWGSSCNGLNPETMGCGADAQTHPNFKYIYDTNQNLIGEVQNRYSNRCLAQWEKTINRSGSAMYAEGSIRWGGIDYGTNMQSINGYTINEEHVYTPMYGSDSGLGPALNCGNLSTSGPIYPPPQPINLSSPYGQNNCIATP